MKYDCKTPKELLKKIKNEEIKMVDLRFTDMPGSTHHISIPIKYLKEDLFKDGVGFDGSSVRGFQSIENSDTAHQSIWQGTWGKRIAKTATWTQFYRWIEWRNCGIVSNEQGPLDIDSERRNVVA